MFPGHESHVYNKLISRAYVYQYARVRTVLTAYMQRRITESTCFLCAQQLNTLLVRDEPFTAPPTVRGTCSDRTLRSSDTTLTVSLYLLTLLSFSLAFEALISE